MQRALSPWLGVAIRRRREARGLSQEELAERADLHRTYVSMVERAVRNISIDALSGIADALEVAPSHLIAQAERLRGAPRLPRSTRRC
jgi:transcriptional regulator with XRE-family HTH domain